MRSVAEVCEDLRKPGPFGVTPIALAAANLIERLAKGDRPSAWTIHLDEGPVPLEALCRRLRGHIRIPITDGLGPAGGEEPDNPLEVVRTFDTPSVQHEAAAMIEELAN